VIWFVRMIKGVSMVLWLASGLFAEDRFFDSAGVRIRYLEQGNGPAVVLLQGYGGSLQAWVGAGLLADSAKDHRVIALELRGYGMSGKPLEPKVSGDQMGLGVIGVRHHLPIPKAQLGALQRATLAIVASDDLSLPALREVKAVTHPVAA
jgi:alpha/beta hydrolase fold